MWLDDDHTQAERRGAFGMWQTRATWQGDEIAIALSRVDGQLPWPYPGCSLTLHLPDGWDAEPLDAADNLQGDTFTVRYRISQR